MFPHILRAYQQNYQIENHFSLNVRASMCLSQQMRNFSVIVTKICEMETSESKRTKTEEKEEKNSFMLLHL